MAKQSNYNGFMRVRKTDKNASLNKVKKNIYDPDAADKIIAKTTDQILKESFERVRERTYRTTSICIKVLFYMELADKFGFTPDQLKELNKMIEETSDSICKEYLTFDDIVRVCQEEFGMKFSKEDLINIDPSLVDESA